MENTREAGDSLDTRKRVKMGNTDSSPATAPVAASQPTHSRNQPRRPAATRTTPPQARTQGQQRRGHGVPVRLLYSSGV